MSLFKWVFGFDQADIESNANAVAAIEKIFPGIFSKINELGSENIDLAEQMNKLKEIYGNIDQKFAPLKENILSLMENVSENTNTLQEHTKSIAETSEKLTSLTEKVGNSDQVLIVYSIVASVLAITALSFIGYCLYQSVKKEREKKSESLNQDDQKSVCNENESEKELVWDYTNFISNASTENTLRRSASDSNLLLSINKDGKNTPLSSVSLTNLFSSEQYIPQTKLPDFAYSSMASTDDQKSVCNENESEKELAWDYTNFISNASTENTLRRSASDSNLLLSINKDGKNTPLSSVSLTDLFSSEQYIPQTKLLLTKLPDFAYSSMASTQGY